MNAPAAVTGTATGTGTATTGRFTGEAWIAFIACTFIWGSTWFVIRTQLGEVPASWSVTWRFALAAAVMFALCMVRGETLRLSLRQHGFALAVAFSQFVLNFNLVYRSEQYLPSGLVSLTFAFLLVTNTALSVLFLGVRVSARFIIGSLIGLAGVALLFAPDLASPASGNVGLGLGLAFGGVISASIANVMQASATGRAMPLAPGLAWAMAWGALIDGAVAWVVAGPPVISLAPGYLAGLAYLGIAASAVAFSLYYRLIRIVGAGAAAWNGVVVPVVALAISTALEGFEWTWTAVAGVALALVGLGIALKAKAAG